MQEALFYTKLENSKVRCILCPWFCELKPGNTGACRVRKNIGGNLKTLVYNTVAALSIDPIEKKPLYHFLPGKDILSLGMVGCNLHCTFCQNHSISQCRAEDYSGFTPISAYQILKKASGIIKNAGIAFTYNEPFIFYEFMLKTAQLSHRHGMKNVMVSNGYVNPEPLKRILPFIDAFNIDLKAFDNKFYIQQTKGKLETVLKTIIAVAESKAHLELTNLVIPGLNDNQKQFEEMVKWIAGECGNEIPLHLSRYFPQYKLDFPATPPETLERLYHVAKKYIHYVYIGNMKTNKFSDTFCPECGKRLIHRNRFRVETEPGFNGNCPTCGRIIPIVL